jgi:hypothetical protein
MPLITAWVPLPGRAGQVVERADDAEHGAEQPDERRVVAEGAEEGDALLVAQALVLDRRGLARLDRGHAVAGVGQAAARDLGLHRPGAGQDRAGGGRAVGRQLAQGLGQAGPGRALGDEEPHPLDHHRDRRDAQRQHQPQHPA